MRAQTRRYMQLTDPQRDIQPHTLDRLATVSRAQTLLRIVQHRNTSAATLTRIAGAIVDDGSLPRSWVIAGICQHPNTPSDVTRALLEASTSPQCRSLLHGIGTDVLDAHISTWTGIRRQRAQLLLDHGFPGWSSDLDTVLSHADPHRRNSDAA